MRATVLVFIAALAVAAAGQRETTFDDIMQDFEENSASVQPMDDELELLQGDVQEDGDVVQQDQQPFVQDQQQPIVDQQQQPIVQQAPVHVVSQAAVHVEGATQYQQEAVPLPALPAAKVSHYQTQTEQTYTTEHPVTTETPVTGFEKFTKNYTTTKMVPVKTHTTVTKYKPVHHEVIIDHNVTQIHYVPVKKTIEVPETEYRTYTTETPVTTEKEETGEVTQVHYTTVKKSVPYKYDTYRTVYHNATVQQPIQTVHPVYTQHKVVQQPVYQQQAPMFQDVEQEEGPIVQQGEQFPVEEDQDEDA